MFCVFNSNVWRFFFLSRFPLQQPFPFLLYLSKVEASGQQLKLFLGHYWAWAVYIISTTDLMCNCSCKSPSHTVTNQNHSRVIFSQQCIQNMFYVTSHGLTTHILLITDLRLSMASQIQSNNSDIDQWCQVMRHERPCQCGVSCSVKKANGYRSITWAPFIDAECSWDGNNTMSCLRERHSSQFSTDNGFELNVDMRYVSLIL